jgi:chromosomal replication initiator protein
LSLAIWTNLLDHFKPGLDPEEFEVWLKPLRPLPAAPGKLVLGCPNAFHRSWVRDHYLPRLKALLGQVDAEASLSLEIASPAAGALPNGAARQLELPRLASSTLPSLNRRYVFERFVAGRSNEFACAAAKAMAQGQRLFSNTLFLVSGTGLGKSHLTQAVGHHVLGVEPGARVAYLTAEDFANQMIAAIRGKRMDQFKDRFRRGCDLLLLEEVQFLAGKDKTQEELSYTLDALWDAGGKVVFTGNCPPHQVKGLKRNLLSRLQGGVTAAIDPPDQATRVRILEAMARDEGVGVERQVMEYLAQELDGDVRRLQSALVGLMAKGSLTGRPMDLALAAEILGQVQRQLRRVTPEQIRDMVAQAYGFSILELTGKSRRKAVSRPRNLALYLCRRHTEASYASLGRLFNRDHSTVIYGVEQIERVLAADPRLGQEVSFLEQRLGVS